jgi:hypothetical protein
LLLRQSFPSFSEVLFGQYRQRAEHHLSSFVGLASYHSGSDIRCHASKDRLHALVELTLYVISPQNHCCGAVAPCSLDLESLGNFVPKLLSRVIIWRKARNSRNATIVRQRTGRLCFPSTRWTIVVSWALSQVQWRQPAPAGVCGVYPLYIFAQHGKYSSAEVDEEVRAFSSSSDRNGGGLGP